VDKNAKFGSVETVIDLVEDSKGEIFNKIPVEIVMKALKKLEEVGKAQVFYSDTTDAHGVKFFRM